MSSSSRCFIRLLRYSHRDLPPNGLEQLHAINHSPGLKVLRHSLSITVLDASSMNKILPTRAEDLVYVHTNLRLLSRKSDHYTKGETRLWDVGGDRFDPLDGAEELEIATLSLDEPEMEAMIIQED
ncbi:hypothetical protein AgCh_008754 [Apium graveolens]